MRPIIPFGRDTGDAGQIGDGLAYGCRGLVGGPEYDDAGVAARRVAADVAQATVQGDQDPACRRGCRDNLGVERTGLTLADDGVDVVASGFQDGGRRAGRFSSSLNLTGSEGSGGVPRAPAARRRRQRRAPRPGSRTGTRR